ncbi:MAG: aldo/keto reductase [Gemmatimonadetes bacterium]|nr:aldo/keto reductase [Gemmatimonadota bacterium]
MAQDTVREVTTGTLPHRVLGKTGERVPILGYGSAPGGMGLSDEDAIALCHKVIDLGVTYIDTAPGYGRAHVQLGQVMAERRDEVFLVTKTAADEAEQALKILENGLKDLQTDHVDLVYVHSMGRRDVDRVLAPDGALAGLREAQRRGWTRFIGVTAHNAPWRTARVLREADIDVVMLAINLADRYTYNFENEVLPLAYEQNVGVAAMKVYGGAQGMTYQTPRTSALAAHGSHDHELALRYALGLPGVCTAVIGMFSEAELVQNLEWARRFTPLNAADGIALEALGREIAADWGPHYGAVE